MNDQPESVLKTGALIGSVWAAVGITSWADAASAVAFLYTVCLLCHWWWKNFWRPFLEERGVLKRRLRRRTDNKQRGQVQPRMLVAMLTVSAAAFVGLAMNEGYTDHAVIPIPGDVPTLGFGTTGGVKLGDRITPPVALQRALSDVGKFEGALKRCVTVPLHQYEYDALIDLAYNIGETAFCSSTLVRKLNAGDYAGACAEISRWVKQPQLAPRRARERATCEGRK